ncbi:dynein heavy chain 5, axonemal [Caerostris extrusa]|uniref:Dynein heavy chain 5, axonemal n=1 Tax=Caerostris extrusa TaxID=172846 RepID=A0AAV4Q232_CAEEX|nr:dynein heavy chain 5, axonemal [Caerostris extrusa]
MAVFILYRFRNGICAVLPSDELSSQNGALVTNALRYPLLIDPQGQGKSWLKNSEAKRMTYRFLKIFKHFLVTSLNHKYFRQLLEECLSLGKPLLIEDVGEELDPILENVLEKNYMKSGSTFKASSSSSPPSWPTRCSLRDQRHHIGHRLHRDSQGTRGSTAGKGHAVRKAELENERVKVISEIVDSKYSIKQLEDNLLDHLTSAQGSLVDNEGLIGILQDTKATTLQVSSKLGWPPPPRRRSTRPGRSSEPWLRGEASSTSSSWR